MLWHGWGGGAGDHDPLPREVCCWEPLLPDQDPLNCSGPPMLFPPAMTCLLSPAAPPNCCESAVAMPSTMPSHNPPRHRSFPAESLPPLCPYRISIITIAAGSLRCRSFHRRHLRQGALVSRTLPGASSLYSSSLRPFLLRGKLMLCGVLARACYSPAL